MQLVTPTIALVSLAKATRRVQNRDPEKASKMYFTPASLVYEAYKYIKVSAPDDDIKRELREQLVNLEKFGYVESKIIDDFAIGGYRKIVAKPYKVRAWRLTAKGIDKLKKLKSKGR